jgi:serine/threonine protein kinase
MTTDPLIGKQLGQFEILEVIGLGGMATVYKARQPAMNRLVALKVLSTPMANNPTFLARFKQEAQLIASLEHAHILPVYDLGEQDGYLFIAMRYMSHGTLASRVAQGPVPLKDVGKWIEQIGTALGYAHQRGVVHRDVKPSNVLLDAQGDAFLADFGIAKWYEGSLDLTGSGVIGTPQYMSPEQGQGLKIDGRSDEYSLAVMAYEMIIGRPPFEGETPLAIVLKHITEPLTPPVSINPHVPQPVSDVISKALSKNPDDRYPTIEAFAQALNAVIAAGPIGGTLPLPSAAPTESVPIAKQRVATTPRHLRPIWIILALLLIVAIGMGGLMIRAANTPQPDRPSATIGLGANVIALTPAPGVTPTSTVPVTESIAANPDRCAPPLFAESFDDPNSGLPHGEQDNTRWGYVDGAYQLFISAANKMQTRLIGPPLADYDATVEARFASDKLGSYGLIAAARAPADYYALMIDGEQHYAVIRRTLEGSRAIQDWTYSPSLNAAQTANRLRVVQRGSEIAFYANGVLLKMIEDEGDRQARRSIGLLAGSFGTGTDARFDNLQVCPPPERATTRQSSLQDAFDDNRNGWTPQQFSALGGSTIENGQFVFETIYPTRPYGISNWNPNLAFDVLDLKVDAQIVTGTPSGRAGVLFGVQDIDNLYLFAVTNNGRYHLDRWQGGVLQELSTGASPLIHPGPARNQIRLSVISNTLSVAVNDRVVLQAAIDYTPGFVGLWCGVFQPDRTLCAFDDLQAIGTPSIGPLILYPFCNCHRTAYVGQPLEVRWRWGAKAIEYLNQFKANTTLSVTLDGQALDEPQQYWSQPQAVGNEAEMFWSYMLSALEPGSHVIEFVVSTTQQLTDGLDENGDGRLDTFGPGDILTGYVEVEVLP